LSPFGRLKGEDIFAIGVHMLKAGRREMGHIVLLNGAAVSTEGVEHGLHVYRILDDDRIGDQVETHRLVGLGFLLFATDDAFVGYKEKLAQSVQGFAFIELGIDLAPIVFTLEIAEDKERLDQAAIFLQGTGEDILPGIGL
jgi:hypothetical protein